MKAMKVGDKVLFYHSNALPSGLAGTAQVCRTAYPDPTQFDKKDGHYDPKAAPDKPIWFQVDLSFVSKFACFIALDELRGMPELADMALFRRSRLSVIAVTPLQWKIIVKRGG